MPDLAPVPPPDSDAEDDSELALTTRLLEVLNAKEHAQIVSDDARTEYERTQGEIGKLEAEADAIKKKLGATSKGRRRRAPSHPTPAGTSVASFREDLKAKLYSLMADGKWYLPTEIIQALDISTPAEKTYVRNLLQRTAKGLGELKRRESGSKTNAGLAAYEYCRPTSKA